MPATAIHALRYPLESDPADVPADMQKLANDVDAALLPATTVAAAATRVIANLLAPADANPAWRVYGDGKMQWGPGGASAPDVNLYRSAAGVLRTDASVLAGVQFNGSNAAGGGTCFSAQISGDATPRVALLAGGSAAWGLGGAGGYDTWLYRWAANFLRCDGGFVGSQFQGLAATSGAVVFHASMGDATPRFGIQCDGPVGWGTGAGGLDTVLHRIAARSLQLDGIFYPTDGLRLPSDHVVVLGGALGPAVGGAPMSIPVAVDGTTYHIPVFN